MPTHARDGLKQWAHAHIPRGMVNLVWNLASDLKDLPARLTRSGPPTPWRVWHNVGGGDFHQIGARYFAYFKEATALRASDHVLDIGCGAGRLAVPIVGYLNETGRYTGFDLSKRALAFARTHVSGRARVHFEHAAVASAEYAGRGVSAAQYRFPVKTGSVDAALAISVFSHLLAEDAAGYLAETGRALRPGGRLFLTGFLIDHAVQARLEQGEAKLALQRFDADSWAADPKHPERAIGFDRAQFDAWVTQAGLRWVGEPEPGHWSRREVLGEFQDRIVLEKT